MSNFREFNNLQNLSNEQSKVYNLDTNHPLIPNSQEYIYYKKYISIHSEDRDYIKYPNYN
jgi:NAD-dependent oxidoreductase involved in siderophore biosynthesis